jgi:predicted MPP superfamily phosphohydrolase
VSILVEIALVFTVFTNIYLYLKLRSGFKRGRWNRPYLIWACVGLVVPFLSRAGAFGDGRVSEVTFTVFFTWAVAVGVACMGFFVMDALSLVARGIDLFAGTTLKNRFFAPRRCVPVTLALIVVVIGYSFFEAACIRRVDVTLTTSKLPEGMDRFRLVHVSDIHLGQIYGSRRLRRLMDVLREAEPDLLAVTGDLVDTNMAGWDEDARLLASHSLKYGAFAVPGNHEYYRGIGQAMDFMKKAGLTVLRGEVAEAGPIAVVGLDDPARFGRGAREPERLPEGLVFPKDRFVLLLKHRPQIIEGTVGSFDLQVAGHTHGGQIWPFRHIVSWLNDSVQHLSFHGAKGESAVWITNGAGFWGPPLRFLTPPEIVVIDLVRP